MGLKTEWISYGDNEAYNGYLARLETQRDESELPAIIVIQEIWGVDDHIKDVTGRLAEAGYAAFAPDLFAESGQRPEHLTDARIDEVKDFMDNIPMKAWTDDDARNEEFAKLPEDRRNRVQESFKGMLSGTEGYMKTLTAAAEFLKKDFTLTKGAGVGSIGFCLGGALSAQLAAFSDHLDCAVVFYGDSPETDIIKKIDCPAAGFYGALDERITGQVPTFAKEMKNLGNVFETTIYDGAPHAFFNDTRPSYHRPAARDAYVRALTFFNRHLSKDIPINN